MNVLKPLIVASLALASTTFAAERNDLPSCYKKAQLVDAIPASSGRELVVVVDQTIPMPEDIQRDSWVKIKNFVQPGDSVKLYSFSAFLPGEYLRLLYSGTLETEPSAETRDSESARKLRTLDLCLAQQGKAFDSGFGKAFVGGLRGASSDIPKSEIMNALRKVGEDMGKSGQGEHVLFLISDMLEHSDYTSFYATNQIKNLNVKDEISKAQKNDLFADLNGARVYVTGAGLVTDGVKQAYRSGKTMDALEAFWADYILQSNGTLEGFGAPSLSVSLE